MAVLKRFAAMGSLLIGGINAALTKPSTIATSCGGRRLALTAAKGERSLDRCAARWRRNISVKGLMLVALLIGFPGCSSQRQFIEAAETKFHSRLAAASIVQVTAKDPSLLDLYHKAIPKSAIFRENNTRADLRAVTGPARMGSFISCYECEKNKNTCSTKCNLEKGAQTTQTEVWVSFIDQIHDFCSKFPRDQVVLKLQQIQGLPPVSGQPKDSWKILLIDVSGPNDLFRPCTDPNPGTSGPCGENFPDVNNPNLSDLEKDEILKHMAWMANQAFYAWQIPDASTPPSDPSKPPPPGYPWTRLGYTYNWDPDAESIVGTSEFVIPKGKNINVVGQANAVDFCTKPLNQGKLAGLK